MSTTNILQYESTIWATADFLRGSGIKGSEWMLINASEKFKPLKKNKGSKRKEIDEVSRLEIVETLARFVDNDYARVFDKEFFYFNPSCYL